MAREPVLVRLRKRLGFLPTEVAAEGKWSRKEFSQIERSADISIEDAIRLGDLYGVDIGAVLDRGEIRSSDVPLAVLLKGNKETLTAFARFAMTSAVSVARDVRRLERLLEKSAPHRLTDFLDDEDLRHPESGNAERLAQKVRERLQLGAVIGSLAGDVARPLGVLIFVAHFRDRDIDAFSLFSSSTGPLIVVNRDSPRIASPFGLRAALAHEVCHLLFDRRKMREVSVFCEMDQPEHSTWPAKLDPVERRTRAFQVELIAPQALVLEHWRRIGSPPVADAIPMLSNYFGLGAVSVGWQLRNAGGPPFSGESTVVSVPGPWPEWTEILPACDSQEVPEMRRGALLELVAEAVKAELISGSLGRELLRVSLPEWERLEARWTSP